MKLNKLKIGGAALLVGALLVAGAKDAKAVASALVTVANTLANPAPTIDARYAAQNQVVLAKFINSNAEEALPRLNEQGIASPEPFVIPAGYKLVVTGMQTHSVSDGTAAVGFGPGLADASSANPVDIFTVKAGDTYVTFPNGYAFSSGQELWFFNTSNANAVLFELHGYLTPL